MITAKVRVHEARRIHDPNFPDAVEHLLTVNVLDLPRLPLEADPRDQNTNKMIYRDVRSSLLNDNGNENAFLGKNLGIYASAKDVVKEAEDRYLLKFGEGDSVLEGQDGILNGGHTAEIIWSSQDEIRRLSEQEDNDIRQFVKLHVRVGYPRNVFAEMAGTLNTTLQVQAYSLAEHQDKFKWIHDAVAGEPYADKVAFKENVNAPVYVTDVLSMLDLFNTVEYPNDGSQHPTGAYHQKSNVLKRYLRDQKAGKNTFTRLEPILNDILTLHDIIAKEGADKYNQYFREVGSGQKRGRAGSLEWVDKRESGFKFPFTGDEGQYRLNRAAIYPTLAAFRWMVADNGSKAKWKGGFSAVRKLWDSVGPEMMKMTQDTSVENARKTQAIGKSPTHYNALHSVVAKNQLMSRAAALADAA